MASNRTAQRGAESSATFAVNPLPNNPIQLTVCVVTPRAFARVAPTQPATDRVR
jgi:hypothetical protein